MKLEEFRIMRASGLNCPLCFSIGPLGLHEIPATNYAPSLAVDIPNEPKAGLFRGYPTATERAIIEACATNDDAIRALVLHWKIEGFKCSLKTIRKD